MIQDQITASLAINSENQTDYISPTDVANGNSLLWLSNEKGYILPVVVFYGCYCIVGICANSITCYGIIRSQRPISVQNIFVLVLLCLDLVQCVCMPVYISDLYLPGQQFSHPLCIIYGSVIFFTGGIHVFTLFLISLHRYFMVVHPKSKYLYFGSRKRTVVIICVSFGINVILITPSLVGVWGRFGHVEPWGICTLIPDDTRASNSFRTFAFGTAFILPFASIIYCYTRIVIVVRKQQKVINASMGGSKSTDKQQRQTINLTVTSMIIAILFLISYLPGILLIFIPSVDTVGYNAFASSIRRLHVVSDPIIYALGDRKLRRYFIRQVCGGNMEDESVTEFSKR